MLIHFILQMIPSCHILLKTLDKSRNIPVTSLGGGYNQKLHKIREQWKVIDTHVNQKVENLIGYHDVDNSLEDFQKWN